MVLKEGFEPCPTCSTNRRAKPLTLLQDSNGAGEEIRTLDIHHGKVALYH